MSTHVVVEVFDNNVEHALGKLKKALLRSGHFRELKRRAFYTPPGQARREKSLRARKLARQRLAKRAVRRDGNGDEI